MARVFSSVEQVTPVQPSHAIRVKIGDCGLRDHTMQGRTLQVLLSADLDDLLSKRHGANFLDIDALLERCHVHWRKGFRMFHVAMREF
ncbi:hypothetical protein D3C76_1471230 [compost metagenome]